VKRQCLENEISAALLLPKGEFNKLIAGNGHEPTLLTGWRADLLGENLVQWLNRQGVVSMEWQDGACVLKMK
jgi:hypothetical protein